ncbi:MAG: NUDIX hydrolase [Deltaproteobacteria bacterium]|nr:NUDIX hydrolase [Deltaproteobacteria bacterium]
MSHHEPEFHYCPVCGGELNTVTLKQTEPPRLVCSRCRFVFYLDPKVVACAVVEVGGRIALLKRGIEPQKGRWVMPGGYVDRGEEVTAAAIRETREECGLDIRIQDLVGVYSYPGNTQVVVVYSAQSLAGNLVAGDETTDTGLFLPEEIPWDQLAFQSTIEALRDYYKKRSKPEP